MIEINDISKVFRTTEVETVALNHVNLEVKEGEFVAIMGPSGCGKSTLLNILGLLDNPTEGSYKLLGQEVGDLKEKERTLIQDLQTQEQSCVEKYGKYAAQAKDPELKSLFETIQKEEQKHYDTLQQVLDGSVPACDCNDTQGKDYEPKVTYGTLDNSEDKQHDAFLATDCIGTEKLVSSEYNTDVFAFANTALRKLLADIQIEEQNHAEMIYKYKTANGMA